MRAWVAQNKTVPVSILRILAADSDPNVRYVVASKRKLTPDLLTRLSHDADESVRLRVAWNPKCPVEILETLAESDPWSEVRTKAARRLSEIKPS
jgi:hypothetical protein